MSINTCEHLTAMCRAGIAVNALLMFSCALYGDLVGVLLAGASGGLLIFGKHQYEARIEQLKAKEE